MFSPGVYYLYMTSTLSVPSNTGLQGPQDKDGYPLAEIMPYPGPFTKPFPVKLADGSIYCEKGKGCPRPALANFQLARNLNYPRNVKNRTDQPMVDENIQITALAFNYNNGIGNVAVGGGSHAIEFRNSRNITIKGCSFNGGNDATAMLGCQSTVVENCLATNTFNAAYDHWDGDENVTVTDSIALAAGGYGILFNAIDTDGTQRTARDFMAARNLITGVSKDTVGIWVNPLGNGSRIAGSISVLDNVVGNPQPAVKCGGILINAGDADTITVTGNVVQGFRGYNPIAAGGYRPNEGDTSRLPGKVIVSNNTAEDNVVDIGGGGIVRVSGQVIEAMNNRFKNNSFENGKLAPLIWLPSTSNMICSSNTTMTDGYQTEDCR